jgi:hypothetical protein
VNYPTAASDGEYIYLIGGRDGSDTNIVQRYDPVTNTWSMVASMNEVRGGPGSFFDGDTIHVIGGGWYTYLDSTETYVPAENVWNAGLPINVGVRTMGVAFGDYMALKAGGWNGSYVDAVEILQFEEPVDPVVEDEYQPDALIKTSGAYKGGNIYNKTGKRQTKRVHLAANASTEFRIRLQNDGNVSDRIRVSGPGNKAHLIVRYYKGNRNITRKVKRGKYKTATLAPGETNVIRLVVTDRRPEYFGKTGYPAISRSWKVSVRSVTEASKRDTVRAVVRATGQE